MARVLLVVLFIVAGCSGGIGQILPPTAPGLTPPAGQGSLNPSGASLDACTVLSDEAIKAGTGYKVVERKHSTLTQVFPSVCDIDLGNLVSLTVNILPSGGKALYETSFEPYIGDPNGHLDQPVSDLGDKAARGGDDTLMVLKGDVLFELDYIEFGRADRFAVVHYLAEVLLGNLSCLASGCPGLTLPPAPATPVVSPTDQGFTGGHPSPSGEKYRLVNLYGGDSVTMSLDVYGWDENGRATVLTTVKYGAVSDFFDPGIGVDEFGVRGPRLSIVPHFHTLINYGFNLYDVAHESAPGTVKTIVATPGDPDSPALGGLRQLGANELLDHDPGGRDYADAVADMGLLAVNADGMTWTGPSLFYYLSVAQGCLALPDFPTVFGRFGGGHSAEGNDEEADGRVVVPAGSWTLTVHPDTGAGGDSRCDNPPAAPGTPLVVANGGRVFLFLYRSPDDPALRDLVLPFGS